MINQIQEKILYREKEIESLKKDQEEYKIALKVLTSLNVTIEGIKEGVSIKEIQETVYKEYELNGKWGYIDLYGNVVLPLIYDDASFFSEGRVEVKKDGKWGFIDLNGNEIIE